MTKKKKIEYPTVYIWKIRDVKRTHHHHQRCTFDMHNLFSIQLPSSHLVCLRAEHRREAAARRITNIIIQHKIHTYAYKLMLCVKNRLMWCVCVCVYKFQFPCRHDANIYNEWPHATPILYAPILLYSSQFYVCTRWCWRHSVCSDAIPHRIYYTVRNLSVFKYNVRLKAIGVYTRNDIDWMCVCVRQKIYRKRSRINVQI